MDVKKDELVVTPRQFVTDEKGNHPEAEEAPAARRVEAAAGLEAPGIDTGGAGLPVIFEMPMTAGEMANNLRTRCEFCKHFNRQEAQKLIDKADDPLAPIEVRMQVQKMRAHLIMTGNAEVYAATPDDDGSLDVEAALEMLGTCRALTEHENEMVFVHPLAACPDEVRTTSAPYGFFEAKESTDRRGVAIYDKILQKADGGLF